MSEGFQREDGSMEVVRSQKLVRVRVRVRVRKGFGRKERKQSKAEQAWTHVSSNEWVMRPTVAFPISHSLHYDLKWPQKKRKKIANKRNKQKQKADDLRCL